MLLMNPQESSGSQVPRGQGELRAPGKPMSSTDVGVGDQSFPKHEVGQEKGHKGLDSAPRSLSHVGGKAVFPSPIPHKLQAA